MSTIEKAIEIAASSHAGVRDKQGQPYILHPLRVMMDVPSDLARIVAVLHDVVEDTPVTIENLSAEGFSAEVLAALELVTHRVGQAYSDYVIHCKANDAARQVKLADLRDNASLNRALLRPERYAGDIERLQRYLLSYRFLTDELSEEEYRRLMSPLEKRDD